MNGTLNIVPWGGPTVRAATALGLQPTDVFVPMIPSLLAGLVVALAFAWFLGLSERKRLAGSVDTSKLDGPAGFGRLGAPKLFRGAESKPGALASLRTGNIVTVRGGAAPSPPPNWSRRPTRRWPTRCSTRTAPRSARSSSGSTSR